MCGLVCRSKWTTTSLLAFPVDAFFRCQVLKDGGGMLCLEIRCQWFLGHAIVWLFVSSIFHCVSGMNGVCCLIYGKVSIQCWFVVWSYLICACF